MLESDLGGVLEIEKASHPTPWPRLLFLQELELGWARLETLRDAEGQLLGYLDTWSVHDELHILNIAVSPRWRRCGCARYMLDAVLARGRAEGKVYVTLEVREHNTGAQILYDSLDFKVVGRRKGYYRDTGEDALIMARVLVPATGE